MHLYIKGIIWIMWRIYYFWRTVLVLWTMVLSELDKKAHPNG
jgi:hypothetical protein